MLDEAKDKYREKHISTNGTGTHRKVMSFQDSLQGRSREREGEAVVLQGHSGASFLGAIYMYFFVLGDISFGCRGHDVNLIDPRK